MRDARCVGSREATLPASRIPPPENLTTPFTMGYSRPHTGQPSMPDRTIRPSISPVDNTRKPSSCRSGQRSISVSSMCTRAELHPRNAVRFDAHAARHAPSPHGYGERVLAACARSEEHTSELQSRVDLVCRLLLEKKNKTCK